MPDHNRKSTAHLPHLIILLGLILILGAVSCRAQTEAAPTPTQPEAAAEIEPSPEPTEEVEEVEDVAVVPAEEVDQCLVCHTDQQTLIDTASPVVDTESESSGEG